MRLVNKAAMPSERLVPRHNLLSLREARNYPNLDRCEVQSHQSSVVANGPSTTSERLGCMKHVVLCKH